MKTDREIEEAIQQYSDMVKKLCFLHVKQQADMEDVFQTVFLKYALCKKEFENKEHEKAWIITVTMNACKDLMGSWFRRKVNLQDDLSYYHMKLDSSRETIWEKVLDLPPNYKNVVYLHYYEGYKITEIANLLHKKENTIHTWLRRAKDILREELGGEDHEETSII